MNSAVDFAKLPRDVLNMLEHYRRTLNLMRQVDTRATHYDELAEQARRLRSGLELRDVNVIALLHDRHWAQVKVPGSTLEP